MRKSNTIQLINVLIKEIQDATEKASTLTLEFTEDELLVLREIKAESLKKMAESIIQQPIDQKQELDGLESQTYIQVIKGNPPVFGIYIYSKDYINEELKTKQDKGNYIIPLDMFSKASQNYVADILKGDHDKSLTMPDYQIIHDLIKHNHSLLIEKNQKAR